MDQAKKTRKSSQDKKNRPLLRDEIRDIDKSILQLLLRRFNLREKLRRQQQKISDDEKIIREAWVSEAIKISQDPQLAGAFFNLLQNLSFRPQPDRKGRDPQTTPGSQRKDAFNLAPPQLPVRLSMTAPLSSTLTEIWIYLASASGKSIGIDPVLPNDALVDLIYNLRQMGASINFELDNAGISEGKPLGAQDLVLSAGSSELNLFLLMAHYICRPSRVKINGHPPLTSLDLKPLANFLPELGCRLTSIIPKTPGLPIRLECTGILPDKIVFPGNLPKMFPLMLGVALLFYEKPVLLDFSTHPDRVNIIKKLEYIFTAVSANFHREDHSVSLMPCELAIPAKPVLPMDACVSSFLLALAEPLRGNVQLKGFPEQSQKEFMKGLERLGIKWRETENSLINDNGTILNLLTFTEADLQALSPLPEYALPLLASLAACAALAGGSASLPPEISEGEHVAEFLSTLGLQTDPTGKLSPITEKWEAKAWLAPNAQWAMALALAACANHSKRPVLLANPGIMTALWSGFWTLYNGLPDPKAKAAAKIPQIKKGRRIITNAIAVPPEE